MSLICLLYVFIYRLEFVTYLKVNMIGIFLVPKNLPQANEKSIYVVVKSSVVHHVPMYCSIIGAILMIIKNGKLQPIRKIGHLKLFYPILKSQKINYMGNRCIMAIKVNFMFQMLNIKTQCPKHFLLHVMNMVCCRIRILMIGVSLNKVSDGFRWVYYYYLNCSN